MEYVQGCMVRMYIIWDICTCSRISLRCIKQKLSVRRFWENLQFCSQCLMHGIRPFFDYIIAHMFGNWRTNYTSAEQKGAFLSWLKSRASCASWWKSSQASVVFMTDVLTSGVHATVISVTDVPVAAFLWPSFPIRYSYDWRSYDWRYYVWRCYVYRSMSDVVNVPQLLFPVNDFFKIRKRFLFSPAGTWQKSSTWSGHVLLREKRDWIFDDLLTDFGCQDLIHRTRNTIVQTKKNKNPKLDEGLPAQTIKSRAPSIVRTRNTLFFFFALKFWFIGYSV